MVDAIVYNRTIAWNTISTMSRMRSRCQLSPNTKKIYVQNRESASRFVSPILVYFLPWNFGPLTLLSPHLPEWPPHLGVTQRTCYIRTWCNRSFKCHTLDSLGVFLTPDVIRCQKDPRAVESMTWIFSPQLKFLAKTQNFGPMNPKFSPQPKIFS